MLLQEAAHLERIQRRAGPSISDVSDDEPELDQLADNQ